jgi:hypothetical protein
MPQSQDGLLDRVEGERDDREGRGEARDLQDRQVQT